MEIQLIRSLKEWDKNKYRWNALLEQTMDDFNPFLSFEWLRSWWFIFGKNKQLNILLLIKDNRLVAIAPLMISNVMLFKICEFIGTGRSDYLGFIIDKSFKTEILPEIIRFISDNLKWDICYLRDCPEIPDSFSTIVKNQKMCIQTLRGDVSPQLRMKGGWEDYLSGKSARHRGNIRRLIRNIEKDKNVSVSCIRDYTLSIVEEMASVESKSWKTDKGELRISGQGKAFYKLFLKAFADNGWLEIWTFRYNQLLLAYNINFSIDDITYFYNVSFDKNSKKYTKYSVGSAVTAFAIRDAFQRKRKLYDFLRGHEPYKQLWTNTSKELYYMVIYKKNVISFLLYLFNFKFKMYLRDNTTFMKIYQGVKNRLK